MSYDIAKPSPILAPYIKQYWAIENCMNKGESHTQRIIPTGLMELTFYLGNKPEGKGLDTGGNLSGQQKEFYDVEVTGNLSIFSVTFKPHGAMMFFNLPMFELYKLNVPLRFIQKNSTSDLESKLQESISFSEKVELIEEYLIGLLRNRINNYNSLRINDSVNVVNQNNGSTTISHLASKACLSVKQYERIFKSCIGISPKQFLRIIRFQYALYQKQINSNIPLTDLAYRAGYYDQSHMVNDFKNISGYNPSQYFKHCDTFSDYFG